MMYMVANTGGQEVKGPCEGEVDNPSLPKNDDSLDDQGMYAPNTNLARVLWE